MAVETEEDMVANVGGCGRGVATGQTAGRVQAVVGEDDGGGSGGGMGLSSSQQLKRTVAPPAR